MYAGYLLRLMLWALGSLRRRWRKAPDYVMVTLDGSYAEFPLTSAPPWQRLFAPPRPSMQELAEQMRRVAADERVRGIVLHLGNLRLPLSKLQTMRGLMAHLREKGKHVVAWANTYDTDRYYLATAADEILLQPGGQFMPLGLKRSFVFLGEALAHLGIKADILQISPYKSAADFLTRSSMSKAAREMMDWLLDDMYSEIIEMIAAGRRLTLAKARQAIDRSPYTDLEALQAGLVDRLLHEEDLPQYLGKSGKPVTLVTMAQAEGKILRCRPPRSGRYIGLLRIEGNIVDGKSRRPPYAPPVPMLLGQRAGDATIVPQIRRAIMSKRIAAVLVYINSPGGSATACEAIAAALAKLAEAKPVVAVLGPVAASGGYYVATPACWLMAQRGSMTGSIGVLWGKVADAGLLGTLRLHRQMLSRGRHADLYDAGRLFTTAERKRIRASLLRTYEVFVERVVKGRSMSKPAVEAVSGGRVWTGRQAMAHGLIDAIGDVEAAAAKARLLAALPANAALIEIKADKLPNAPVSSVAATLNHILEGIEQLSGAQCLCPFVPFDP